MAKKSKFSGAEIIGAIKEIDAGALAKDVARQIGVSYEAINRWRANFGGMEVGGAQEKRPLEDENAKRRRVVARYALEIVSLKVALGKSSDGLHATGGRRVV